MSDKMVRGKMSHFLIVFWDKFLNKSCVNSGDKFAGKF